MWNATTVIMILVYNSNCSGCDERYEGSLLPACQSGCGFHFDNDVTSAPPAQPPAPSFRPRSDAPIPIFTRPVAASQPPPPARASQQPPALSIPFRPQNPFLNLFRSPGPVMVRKNVNLPLAMMPRSMGMARSLNVSPEMPEAPRTSPIVTKQLPSGPTVIGFSLPQLLSKVNSLIPQLSQHGGPPRVMEISINRNPFGNFQQEFEEFPSSFGPSHRHDEMDLPELPRMMEGLFGRKDHDLEPLLEEVEELFGDEEDLDNDVEHFMQENIFGHKDDDIDPFAGLFSQFGKMMNSLPQVHNNKTHSSMFGKKDDDSDPLAGIFAHMDKMMDSLIPQVLPKIISNSL